MAKTFDEKILAAREKIRQEEAYIKSCLQQQKAEEWKERNHRLCKRGGQVEKLLPGLVVLTDDQFKIFVQKTLLTPHTKRILAELAPPVPAPAAGIQESASTVQSNGNTLPKSTEAVQAAG